MTIRAARNPQPPARPMKTCPECRTSNEAWRRRCRNCNEELAAFASTALAREVAV